MPDTYRVDARSVDGGPTGAYVDQIAEIPNSLPHGTEVRLRDTGDVDPRTASAG